MSERLGRALIAFDAHAFARRHGGYKESNSHSSHEYLLPCPGCGSDRLRWRHNPPKMAFVCWGCRKVSGDTIRLVQIMERVELPDAIAYIVDGYSGGDAPTELKEVAIIQRPAMRLHLGRLAPMQWPNGVEPLTSPAQHARAWEYLMHMRGFDAQSVLDYRLGFGRHGRLTGYIVFPVFMDGGLVYYQGRASWDPLGSSSEERKRWVKLTNYRKTLNPMNRDGQAHAEDVLFNYDRAFVEPHVVICEGPIDAMKVGKHAVALLGKKASRAKIERLLRMHASRYTIYLDRGEEEREAALDLAAELSGFAPVDIATPPKGFDPGKMTREQNQGYIEAAESFRARGLSSALKIG